jgi:hypothetical protein
MHLATRLDEREGTTPRGRGVCEPAALPYDVRTAYASFDVLKSISNQRRIRYWGRLRDRDVVRRIPEDGFGFTHALLLDTFASLAQPPKTAPELDRIEQLRAMAMALPMSL